MKKNILLIILLLVIIALAIVIFNLSNRAKTSIPTVSPKVVAEEGKEEPQEEPLREEPSKVDTEFLRYGIRPREAKYYE